MQPQASTLVILGIPALALLVLALLVAAVHRTHRATPHTARRVAVVALAWLVASGLLAAGGLLARFDVRPPTLLLVVVPAFALPILLALSRAGARMATELPLWTLVGAQAFRLPLELVMHAAARQGTMPEQMTFTGVNLDIVTGSTAILVAALAYRGHAPRALLLAWNLLGTVLLAAIIVIAIASTPLFGAFGTAPHQLNTWVAYLPFVWLPAILVAAALLGHLLLWRRLWQATPSHAASSAAAT